MGAGVLGIGGTAESGGRRWSAPPQQRSGGRGRAVEGSGSTSEPRGTRSRRCFGLWEGGGGGSAWSPWAAATMARRRAPWRREKLGSALEKGKGVERGRARLLHEPKGRKQAREEARRGRLSLHGVAVALRRPSSACVPGTATRGGSRSSRKAPGVRRGLGRGEGAARGRRRDGERRHGENREGRWR